MKFVLGSAERVKLLLAAYTARGATIRRRARWVLLIADGASVSLVGRLAGVSRPTVYRYLRIYLATRDPEALRSAGSGRRLARARKGPGIVEEPARDVQERRSPHRS
jgi:DNA-binding CsgD family transcriptional regulator